ncbi:potassium channel family protein [Bifidobacterium simiarum]|uniref:potassium channel family protein n=1 Tax=Bifidobacterium simiarum TaxID=2045441 RepID=UPI001FAFB21B|nr:potassium channel family protein [Bifidobacterium simiarum]
MKGTTSAVRESPTLKIWRKWTEWPLTAAAVVFLIAYSWQVLGAPPNTQGASASAGSAIIMGMTGSRICETVMNVVWVLFAIDYVVSLALANDRRHWFVHHLFDLASVVLPVLRPLRLLRLFMVLKVLNRTSGMALRGRIAIYVVATVTLMIYVGALAMFDVERRAGDGMIDDFGDAVWWAFVTVTTVGYGDYAPVTWQGRCIAAALMLGGITLIGVITAMVASWIMERVETGERTAWGRGMESRLSHEMDEDARAGERRDMRLMERLDLLSARLDGLDERLSRMDERRNRMDGRSNDRNRRTDRSDDRNGPTSRPDE